jgi:hypothetical protein
MKTAPHNQPVRLCWPCTHAGAHRCNFTKSPNRPARPCAAMERAATSGVIWGVLAGGADPRGADVASGCVRGADTATPASGGASIQCFFDDVFPRPDRTVRRAMSGKSGNGFRMKAVLSLGAVAATPRVGSSTLSAGFCACVTQRSLECHRQLDALRLVLIGRADHGDGVAKTEGCARPAWSRAPTLRPLHIRSVGRVAAWAE